MSDFDFDYDFFFFFCITSEEILMYMELNKMEKTDLFLLFLSG